jgi:hypothetical protein
MTIVATIRMTAMDCSGRGTILVRTAMVKNKKAAKIIHLPQAKAG